MPHAPLIIALVALGISACAAEAPPSPWPIGEVRLVVPELPPVGETFEITVECETGSAILAALTLEATWNAAGAKLLEVEGGLSMGRSAPLATNRLQPGRLVISDINAPRAAGGGAAIYNNKMRGRIAPLYTLVFRRTGEAPLGLASKLSHFHDPGDNKGRGPTQIGGGPFPRRAKIHAAETATPTVVPTGLVWMTRTAAEDAPSRQTLQIWVQLDGKELGGWTARMRFDSKRVEIERVENGRGEKRAGPSLPGELWLTGAAEDLGTAEDDGRVLLARIQLVQTKTDEAEAEGAEVAVDELAVRARLVTLAGPTGEDGEPSAIGDLPLPRAVELQD